MSLQVWLPLTKDLRQQGLSNITVTNNGAIFNANGKLGGCYSVDNVKQIGCNNCLNLGTTFSIAFWSKINSKNVDWGNIFKIYKDGADYIGMCLAYTTDTNPKLGFHIYRNNGSNAREAVIDGYKEYSLNNWFHTVITVTPTKAIVYKNGVVFNTFTISKTFPSITNYSLWLGKNGIGNGLDCSINDFRIYDHCLSQTEVKELAKGLVLHYPLNDTSLDSKPNLVPPNYWTGSKSLSLSANTTSYSFMNYPTMNVQPNKTYYWTIDVRITSGAANLTSLGIDTNCIAGGYSGNDSAHTVITVVNPNLTKIKAGEWQTAYCITTVKSDATNPQILHCLYGASSTTTTVQVEYRNLMLVEASSRVPLRFWQGDIGYDCSGYCNNGVKVGTLSCDFDTPRYNVSTHFNGSSAIKNNTFSFSSNQWTASFWYKFTTAPSAYQGFLCLSRNAGGDADKKIAAMPNSNYIWIKFESINYTLSSLKVNEWCHIVLTCDGNVGKVYENGTLKYTTGSVGSILTNCDDFVVGARANSADAATTAVYLNGNMSDVRIYATALSAEDVLELYHTAARIDNIGNTYVYQYIET